MANIPFVDLNGETITLAGNGGNDNALISNLTYFANDDTITGAAGVNYLVYTDSATWTTTFGPTFTGISGIEGIQLNTSAIVGLAFQDGFLANNNSSGVFSITTTNAAAINIDASALTASYSVNVQGSANADTVVGGNGNDVFQGSPHNDSVSLGAGNDTVSYAIAATVTSDTLVGGTGIDLISFGSTGTYALENTTFTGFEQLSASGDGSIITLSASQVAGLTSISMVAGGGNDTLGLSNAGTVDLSSISVTGVDVVVSLNSSPLNITLATNGMKYIGSTANDTVYGSVGNDSISPLGGGDFVYCSDGNDLIYYTSMSNFSGDVIDGGTGIDTLSINVASGFDLSLATVTNFEVIQMGVDGSTVDMTTDNAGTLQALQATAGGAVDRINITGGGTINIAAGNLAGFDVIANGDSAVLTLSMPSTGNRQFQGGTVTDSVMGGSGDETLFGYAGDDTLNGQLGNDALVGGDGSDQLQGSDGNDMLFGGPDATALGDTLEGGLGADTLDGGDGADSMTGGDGDDLIFAGSTGSGNADSLYGDAGNDTLIGNQAGVDASDLLVGGLGDDVILGGAGVDTLQGVDGNDIITGGDGTDSILAGLGNDVMWGDAGADIFAFLPADGIDTIADFQVGVDHIDLIGRNFGNYTAFSLAVTQTVEANGLTLTFNDGAKIMLYGVTSLTDADFLL